MSDLRIVLPFITEEMWGMFNETSLMTWNRETDRPDWTQDAVDFVSYLPIRDFTSEEI